MKANIIPSIMGVLGLGEDGKIISKILFSSNSSVIARKLIEIESGRSITEVTTLIKKLREKGYTTFVFENSELAQTIQKKLGVEIEVEMPSEMGEALRQDMGRYAVEVSFLETPSDITEWVHDVSMEMSRIKLKKATEKRDLLVIQAIQSLDDLDKTINLFMCRIREWYGLHFPELNRLINKHEVYAGLALRLGKRENFTAENLEKEGLREDRASRLVEAARTSIGAHFYETDMEQIQTMCKDVLGLYDTRSRLENYIGKIMKEVAKNTSALTGATLGARFIAHAGGLDNLAKMPASTIQVLGAEKALFRSLTTGARPPKHGIIFQHALIHESKPWMRGKIARSFAGKLAIAVRTDAFSGNYIGDMLKTALQKRIEEIKRKHAKPKSKPSEKWHMKRKGKSESSRKRRKRYGRKG